jgi:hypothetical protein
MQHFFLANAKSDAEGEKGFSTKESMNGKDRLQVCFTKHQFCFAAALLLKYQKGFSAKESMNGKDHLQVCERFRSESYAADIELCLTLVL